MDATVIKFDPLTYSVRTAAENHNLLFRTDNVFIDSVISRVPITRIVNAANLNFIPRLFDANRKSALTNNRFRNIKDFSEIFIGKTIKFRLLEEFIR